MILRDGLMSGPNHKAMYGEGPSVSVELHSYDAGETWIGRIWLGGTQTLFMTERLESAERARTQCENYLRNWIRSLDSWVEGSNE